MRCKGADSVHLKLFAATLRRHIRDKLLSYVSKAKFNENCRKKWVLYVPLLSRFSAAKIRLKWMRSLIGLTISTMLNRACIWLKG